VILTDGDKMIKTPTYHVFDMYKWHQDAELVQSSIDSETIGVEDEWKTPFVQESVSFGKDGKLHITLCNTSVDKAASIEASLADTKIKAIAGEIVGGEIHEHNTFDNPDCVVKKSFDQFKVEDDCHFTVTLPHSSVVHLAVEI
jgi:alpha-N-arabinofuranosidase